MRIRTELDIDSLNIPSIILGVILSETNAIKSFCHDKNFDLDVLSQELLVGIMLIADNKYLKQIYEQAVADTKKRESNSAYNAVRNIFCRIHEKHFEDWEQPTKAQQAYADGYNNCISDMIKNMKNRGIV